MQSVELMGDEEIGGCYNAVCGFMNSRYKYRILLFLFMLCLVSDNLRRERHGKYHFLKCV